MKVFVRVTGQEDNIGDIVLRRRLLKTAAEYGPLYVFNGDHSDAYTSGLHCSCERLFPSYSLWWSTMLEVAEREPVLLFDKPGELQNSWAFIRSQVKARVQRLRLRRRGGRAVLLGVGMRHSMPWPKRFVLRAALSDYRLIGWRDIRSHEELALGDVMPDWAFGEDVPPPPPSGQRDLLIVSMRGDRPLPSARWFELLRSYATAHHLRIEVVTQVGRDQARSGELAAQLGAMPNPWLEGDYEAQEQALRSLYRQARLVISDRMHVLIMAAVEGAVPLCLTDAPEEKIERHFRAINFPNVSFTLASNADGLLARQADRAEELGRQVAFAKGAIAQTEQRLKVVLRER